jgi:hypothetical protein
MVLYVGNGEARKIEKGQVLATAAKRRQQIEGEMPSHQRLQIWVAGSQHGGIHLSGLSFRNSEFTRP